MLRNFLFLVLPLSSATPAYTKAHKTEQMIHVNAMGDDRANGSSAELAVRTLRRARDIMRHSGAPKTALLSGRFELAKPLWLGPEDAGTQWRASPEKPALIVGINGAAMAFQVNGADGVGFIGLQISGFVTDGIRIAESRNATVIDNTISSIHSNAWSQAAIHLMGNVSGARVVGNTVAITDYSGIAVTTNPKSQVNDLQIARNTVRQTCRKIRDCGGIYISDRGRRSHGSVIEYNVIQDIGPADVGGRGIYLDDWASGVRVRYNQISGRGAYGMQIHGGSNNTIEHNLFDARLMTNAFYVQPVEGQAAATMTGNMLHSNRFVTDFTNRMLMKLLPKDQAAAPQLKSNEHCIAPSLLTYTVSRCRRTQAAK